MNLWAGAQGGGGDVTRDGKAGCLFGRVPRMALYAPDGTALQYTGTVKCVVIQMDLHAGNFKFGNIYGRLLEPGMICELVSSSQTFPFTVRVSVDWSVDPPSLKCIPVLLFPNPIP